MLRTLSLIAAILAALFWAYPADAAEATCSTACACQKQAAEKAAAPDAAPAAPQVKTDDVKVAEKCSCSSAADCTCKKGQCKCKACGGASSAKL